MTRYAHFHPETAGVGITEKWVSASQVLVGTYCYNLDRPNWLVASKFSSRDLSPRIWRAVPERDVPKEYVMSAMLLT